MAKTETTQKSPRKRPAPPSSRSEPPAKKIQSDSSHEDQKHDKKRSQPITVSTKEEEISRSGSESDGEIDEFEVNEEGEGEAPPKDANGTYSLLVL